MVKSAPRRYVPTTSGFALRFNHRFTRFQLGSLNGEE